MCDPVTLFATSVAITATAEGVNYLQESRNADAQRDYQRYLYGANAELANEAANSSFLQLARRELQEREQASKAIADVTNEATLARGGARVGAASAGVAGNSVKALLDDFRRQELDYQTVTQRNLHATELQLQEERKGVAGERQGRILSMLPQPVQKPSLLNSALRVGGQAFNAYQNFTYYDRQAGRRRFGRPGDGRTIGGLG